MRRAFVSAAALIVAGLLLAGCGRDDSADDGGPLTIDDSPASGEIAVWVAGSHGATLEPFVDAFAAENPDATVEVTEVPWAEVTTKITSALAAGTVPDLMLVSLPDIPMLVASEGVQPVAEGVIDPSAIFAQAQTAVEHDGTAFGVPWFVETRLFCFRKDFAAQAGAAPPATWSGLQTFSTALTAIPSVEYPLLVPIGADEPVAEFLLPLLAQAGGAPLDGDSYTLDTPEMVEALSFYGSLFTDGHASVEGTAGGDPIGDAVTGRVAAFYVGTWIIPAIASQVGEYLVETALACTVVPAGSAGATSYLGSATWTVPTDAANPDGAFKLLRSLMTTEAQQALFDATNELPAVTAAWEHEPLQDDPWIATSITQLDDVIPAPAVPSWNEVAATIAAEAEKVARGTATAEEAAAAIQQKADELGTGW